MHHHHLYTSSTLSSLSVHHYLHWQTATANHILNPPDTSSHQPLASPASVSSSRTHHQHHQYTICNQKHHQAHPPHTSTYLNCTSHNAIIFSPHCSVIIITRAAHKQCTITGSAPLHISSGSPLTISSPNLQRLQVSFVFSFDFSLFFFSSSHNYRNIRMCLGVEKLGLTWVLLDLLFRWICDWFLLFGDLELNLGQFISIFFYLSKPFDNHMRIGFEWVCWSWFTCHLILCF